MATVGRRFSLFDALNYAIMMFIAFLALYPIWYVIVVSLSTQAAYYADPYHIIPRSFSLEAYQYAVRYPTFIRAFINSTLVTTGGIAVSLTLSTMGGYVLSKHRLKGRLVLLIFVVITMFFDGGIVPFVLVVRTVGLAGTLFAYFLPRAINPFWMILMKNYFLGISQSIEDSAKMDGANDFVILARIIVPISKPIVFTVGMFYGVFFWNDFLLPMLFAGAQESWTLALFLRFLIGSVSNMSFMVQMDNIVGEMAKAAFIVLSMLPIVAVYPFVQRHYVKGIMLGGVKE